MKLDSSISAIVTGGASGLGGATVKALRAQGVKVAIFDLNEKLGTQFAAETGATYCNVNVTDEASVDAGFAKARAFALPDDVAPAFAADAPTRKERRK